MHTEYSTAASAKAEWKAGWPLVLATLVGSSVNSLSAYPLGLFVVPLEKEFGWSRTLITSGLTIHAVVAVLFSAFVGVLIDRFGPRRIAIPGLILFCALFASLSTASGSAIHWWTMWLALSFSMLMLKPTVWSAAVASRFDRSRGLAMAIGISGSGLTALVSPILTGYLLDNFGWRWAYIGLSATYLAVALPLVSLFFFGSSDLDRTGRRKDRTEKPKVASGSAIRKSLQSSLFWRLTTAVFLIMLAITGATVHFIPILLEGKVDRDMAIAAASMIGLTSLAGRMMSGALLDRLNARFVGGCAFAIPGVCAVGLLLLDLNGFVPIGIALLFGTAVGAELEIAAYLTSRHFGLRNFGALFGFIAGFIAFAAGVGPQLASFAFDQTGSYDIALVGWAVCSITASLLIILLPNYKSENYG